MESEWFLYLSKPSCWTAGDDGHAGLGAGILGKQPAYPPGPGRLFCGAVSDRGCSYGKPRGLSLGGVWARCIGVLELMGCATDAQRGVLVHICRVVAGYSRTGWGRRVLHVPK